MAVQSDAERAREKGLKDDPLALVISPSQVQCRQCKKLIKLSSKSAYDPFHWRNHRTRCVKLSKAKAKMTKKPSAPKSSSSSPAHQTASNRPLRIAASPGETRSVKTPPLTSDSEDDRRPERFVESHSPLGRSYASSSQSPTPATPQPGFSTNKYIHPDYVRRPGSVSVGHWQSWSWSQLKPRQFSVAYEYGSGDDMSDDLSDSLRGDDDPEDRIRQDAARSLSLLSQSNERNHGSSVDFSLPL
ncbi:hypothetical protein B0H34DRAFT_406247 [Crassisporium funariophilum]|nr:hypothetical protein B0H34DRAFT_406247 [Crassisporium funariophilum]